MQVEMFSSVSQVVSTFEAAVCSRRMHPRRHFPCLFDLTNGLKRARAGAPKACREAT